MARCTSVGLALLAPLLAGASCDGISCPPATPPMTEARAKEIDPSVETGLAVSTTYVFGDCRPGESVAPTSACGDYGRCARERSPLRVLAVPVNRSVAIDDRCDPMFSVEDAAAAAAFDGYASDQGELVVALAPGRYTLLVSADDRCAACGLTEQGSACTADVISDQLTVRELILDRSSH